MIMKNDFSFAHKLKEQQLEELKEENNEELKEEQKNDYSISEEDVARMQMIKAMHGPIPDRYVEISLIKKYP